MEVSDLPILVHMDNDDGTVRQLWETITEDDKITIAFDGLYRKKVD